MSPFMASLKYISLVVLRNNLDSVVAAVVGIRLQRIPALNDTVLNVGIISDIYVVENDGILNHAVLSNEYFLKQNGILHLAVDDTTAGNQAIVHFGANIVLRRRQIIHLGINLRLILEKVLAHLRLKEIHISLILGLHRRDVVPVFLHLVAINLLHVLVANQDIRNKVPTLLIRATL